MLTDEIGVLLDFTLYMADGKLVFPVLVGLLAVLFARVGDGDGGEGGEESEKRECTH